MTESDARTLALIARVKEAEEVLAGADHTAAKYWRKMREAEVAAGVAEDQIARLREAEACIAAIEAIEPMWPRGMYGAPQDMIGRNQVRAILSRYKPTTENGSE